MQLEECMQCSVRIGLCGNPIAGVRAASAYHGPTRAEHLGAQAVSRLIEGGSEFTEAALPALAAAAAVVVGLLS